MNIQTPKIRLPRTGQVTSYATGDDGYFQAGNPRKTRFVDNGNGTVSDRATGLMWVKDHNAVGAPFNAVMNWAAALTNIATLNGAGYAGYKDWRLPNAYELASLLDATHFGPRIDPIFTNTQNDFYWTSTTDAAFDPAYAFIWYFYYAGGSQHAVKTASYYVRPVRGGRLNAHG
jgi:hypothetical protein